MDLFVSLFHLPPESVLLLAAVSFVAAIVDSIAGGGGLLNVPAMMLAGLPPVSAVATNKLQGTFGVLSSARTYARAGLIDARAMRGSFIAAFVAAGIGAIAAQMIPSTLLRVIVPFILLGLALFVALSPKLTDSESRVRMAPLPYALAVAPPIAFYDGFFGPGGGTFFFITLVTLAGLGVTRAAANAKFLNVASNAGALALFAFSGHLYWALGLVLGLAAWFGARIGARAALSKGAALIKPLVIIVSSLMALRLLFDPTHPVGAWLRGG
ncbi:MAG: TSUP family transporter [Proteobacteria bacterium]|nr:TSUP family transporter [Pseudomonadota bacterium]